VLGSWGAGVHGSWGAWEQGSWGAWELGSRGAGEYCVSAQRGKKSTRLCPGVIEIIKMFGHVRMNFAGNKSAGQAGLGVYVAAQHGR
jgi:hypothetical protein